VCARYIITGTGSGEELAGKAIAGKTISVPGASILAWKDGKIFRSYSYRNDDLAMRQLGLLSAAKL
jgi:hypothetical protein